MRVLASSKVCARLDESTTQKSHACVSGCIVANLAIAIQRLSLARGEVDVEVMAGITIILESMHGV